MPSDVKEPIIIPAQEPSETATQSPETSEITQIPTKSDTQQIIDSVLAFIEAESADSRDKSDYWNVGTDGYRNYWISNGEIKEPAFHILFFLRMNYNSQYPRTTGYDFPKIQEDLAVFDISVTLDYGFTKSKSIIRFNLTNLPSEGWKITDLRLIYTDWNDYKQYVS